MKKQKCWYCKDTKGEMVFSWEFDTLVHKDCLIPNNDQEANIMKREFGIPVNGESTSYKELVKSDAAKSERIDFQWDQIEDPEELL